MSAIESNSQSAVLNDYLSEPEFAEAVGRCERTVQRWRALGEGPPFTRVGREIYYHANDIRDWLRRRRVDPMKR